MKPNQLGRDLAGLGIVSAVTLLFVGLKQAGLVDWSWWWVVAPLWIASVLFLAILLGVVVSVTWSARK